jgi:predicted HTH transcriptional regulator
MSDISREELIGLGEHQVSEFKKSLALQKEAFIALCGMVNARAARAVLVFGVTPEYEIVGLADTNLDTAQRTLAQHAGQKFDPRLAVEIRPAKCEGKPILILTASRLRSVPYHEYDGRAYIREGSSTRQLTLVEKQGLVRERDRNLHNGPWRCDRCGAFAGTVSGVELTGSGPRRTFRHNCGGEWWPAT